jgi:uncharacterized membrane protein YjjP (DUF1212 family)
MMTYSESQLMAMIEFIKELARALIECGCSSNRVEALSGRLAKAWNVEIEMLAIPTGAWIVLRSETKTIHELTRIKSWSINLDRLSKINDLIEDITANQRGPAEATKKLQIISNQGGSWPRTIMIPATGLASSGLMFFYGGSVLEIFLAGLTGIMVTLIHKRFRLKESRRYLSDFICATAVTAIAIALHSFYPSIDESRLVIAAIIIHVPGLPFVNAIHEIAQKNLVSGTAKLLDALVIGVSLAFGVVFVKGLQAFLG